MKNEIVEYVSSVQRCLDKKYKGDEVNTVVKFVVPLFRLLGWDEKSEDVEFQQKLKGGKADIALKLFGEPKPKIIIEVKCIQDNLSKKTAEQAAKYLHTSGVRWGVICNGKEIRLYDMKYMPKKSEIGRELFKMSHQYFEKYFNILRILSKGNVSGGMLDSFGDNYLKMRRETDSISPMIKRVLRTEEAGFVRMLEIIKKIRDRNLHLNVCPVKGGYWSKTEIANYMDHLMKHGKKSYAYFGILTEYNRPITRKQLTKRIAQKLKIHKLSPIAIAGIRAGIDSHTRRRSKQELELETSDWRLCLNPRYRRYFSGYFRNR